MNLVGVVAVLHRDPGLAQLLPAGHTLVVQRIAACGEDKVRRQSGEVRAPEG